MKHIYLLTTLLLCSVSGLCQIPAFPGAEGFGSTTPGGRGGKVIKVLNLNDDGPGSFREALETPGPRIIAFNVGGTINLKTKLFIDDPWVTIAGQTASGDGICVRGEGIRVRTHDVVIRYLRFRPGDVDFGLPNQWNDVDAVSISGGDTIFNIVVDHCSLSWAVDENIDMWGEVHDITIQNCIISEALLHSKHPKGAHSMGMLIGSKATNISVHHNLFAHNNDRNPHINGVSRVDFRNNVIYDPGGVAIDISGGPGQVVNLINNYLIKGPATRIKSNILLRDIVNKVPKLYVEGNIGVFKNVSYRDDWELVNDEYRRIPNRALQLTDPFPHPKVTTQPASVAYKQVLQGAGATLPRRDAVDRKVIRDINENKGAIIDRKENLLGWPPLRMGTPFRDSDDDGMPDQWEATYQLPDQQPDNNQDQDGDGYTNIEEFLNNTDPFFREGDNEMLLQGKVASLAQPLSAEFVPDFQQNYPNPFANTTQIKFTIAQPSQVFLTIFDPMGRTVSNLVEGLIYEGEYEFVWDASEVVPGMYIINLRTAEFNKSIKTVISR